MDGKIMGPDGPDYEVVAASLGAFLLGGVKAGVGLATTAEDFQDIEEFILVLSRPDVRLELVVGERRYPCLLPVVE